MTLAAAPGITAPDSAPQVAAATTAAPLLPAPPPKGSISGDLSYPLRRLLGGGPDFYLFAQSFTGYGENLLDYNKRVSRLRLGVALVR